MSSTRCIRLIHRRVPEKGIAVSSDDTLPHFEGPYTIVQFLLFLVDLLDCRISNLLIPGNKRRFESRPLRQL
jgi:hypothetical protein